MNKINVNINVDSVGMKSLFNADAIEMNKNLNLSNNSSVTTNQNLNTALTETLDISAVNKETETLSLTNNQANNPQVSNFSPNTYSDKDNIYINELSDIMTATKNNLGEENYKIYTEYLKGKKLSEIYTADDKLSPITDETALNNILKNMQIDKDASQVMEEINQVLQNSNFAGSTLSEDMRNSTIIEVANTESGYDAFVLKNSVGNYLIVNSCTNDKSAEDIAAIAYTLSLQLVGDEDLISFALNDILPEFKNENIESSEIVSTIIEKGTDYLKEKNQGQLQDNKDLIEKYAAKAQEEGSKLELNGYSLGGGIQLAAYSQICIDNPDIENTIESVAVFNPFVAFAEQQRPAGTGNPLLNITSYIMKPSLIQYLSSSEKLRIYSGQEDMVSTFNTSVEVLKDKYVFLHAKDIENGAVQNIGQLYGIIIGDNSNHGFGALNQEYFNEYGNITEVGEFIPITETVADATNQKFASMLARIGNKFGTNNYNAKYSSIVNEVLNLANVKENIEKTEDESVKLICKEIVSYIENNVGNMDYEGLAQSLTDGCWKAVEYNIVSIINPKDSITLEKTPDLFQIGKETLQFGMGTLFKDEELFKSTMMDFLTEEETKKDLISIISYIGIADKGSAEIEIKALIKKLDEKYTINIFFRDKGLKGIVNGMIKDIFIQKLESALITTTE